MKNQTVVILMFLLLPVVNFGQQNQNGQAYSIENIKAYLYLDTKGTLSRDITDNFSLFNTVIGEGDAGSPSHSTMVVVKIRRNYRQDMETRKIRLIATEQGKPKLDKTIDFSVYDNNYTYYAAFWLYDTGCGSVTLTAEILNDKSGKSKKSPTIESKMEKTIDFGCGE